MSVRLSLARCDRLAAAAALRRVRRTRAAAGCLREGRPSTSRRRCRTKPGASNASPGVTATRASSSSAWANSVDVREPVGRQHLADVEEQVERAGRLAAAKPRIGGQPGVQLSRRFRYSSSIVVDRRLRSGQRRDDRLLRDRARRSRSRGSEARSARRSPPPGRSTSRSASRSSRRPSTPSRRSPTGRGSAGRAPPAGCAATAS